MENKVKQLGAIRTFFIVGFVLTCVLITSIVYVKNHGEDVRKTQTVPTSQTQTKPAEDDSKTVTNEDDTSTAPDQSTTDNTTDNSAATADTTQDLPTTGLESTLAEMLVIFALTFGISSYFVSRNKKANASL